MSGRAAVDEDSERAGDGLHEISEVCAVSANRSNELEGGIARAVRRLTPFLMAMYVVSFLDRSNSRVCQTGAEQTSVGIS